LRIIYLRKDRANNYLSKTDVIRLQKPPPSKRSRVQIFGASDSDNLKTVGIPTYATTYNYSKSKVILKQNEGSWTLVHFINSPEGRFLFQNYAYFMFVFESQRNDCEGSCPDFLGASDSNNLKTFRSVSISVA